MWVYKMNKPLNKGETMAEGVARLRAALLNTVYGPSRCYLLVEAGDVMPVVYVVPSEKLSDAAAGLLSQQSSLLPLDVRLAWVDDVIADHVNECGVALRAAATAQIDEMTERLRRIGDDFLGKKRPTPS